MWQICLPLFSRFSCVNIDEWRRVIFEYNERKFSPWESQTLKNCFSFEKFLSFSLIQHVLCNYFGIILLLRGDDGKSHSHFITLSILLSNNKVTSSSVANLIYWMENNLMKNFCYFFLFGQGRVSLLGLI